MREEIVAGPLELYVAPVGTAFPELDATPAGAWSLVGASGDKNYDEDGVAMTLGQTLNPFTPAGSTLAAKVFRSGESVIFHVNVADARLATLALALNDNDVDSSGPGTDTQAISLLRGVNVTEYALLARGVSPVNEGGRRQFQVPRCYQSAEPEVGHVKADPSMVELEFTALDPDTPEDFLIVDEDADES